MKVRSHITLPVLLASILLVGNLPLLRGQGFFQYEFDIAHPETEINSPVNDYAPALSADGSILYVTSSRLEGSLGKSDIYSIPRSGNEWGRAVNPGEPLNSKRDDGSIAYSPDGTFLLFASDNRKNDYGQTDLYIGIIEAGVIVDARNLGPVINSSAWDSQPTMSSDGTTFYFASDRPGGQGGTDIWMTRIVERLQDGTPIWGKPENLGPMVNTPMDERSPFISGDDATLYFATDGREGYGGFDIYASIMQLGEWSEPVNLGAPINSVGNEMFFTAPRAGKSFFFASTRPGGLGEFDVYVGTPNIFGEGLFHITFNVVDSTDRPLPGVVTIADPETGDTVSTFITSIGQLDYIRHLPAGRRYRVTAIVPGRPKRTIDLEPGMANETRRMRLTFNPFTVAEFDLAKYNIPFFVSGYYRPNVSTNLEALFGLLKGRLKKATYIEQFSPGSRKHREYRAYARVVDTVFGSIYRQAVDNVFPRFERDAMSDEVLEIRVTGLADPQPFVGTYFDEEIATFVDTNGVEHTVTPGSQITNFELSGLRAWYSAQLLDRLFALATGEGKAHYERLKAAGKIRMKIIGGSVATAGGNYESQRRIAIEIVRTNGRAEFDLDTMPHR